MIAEKVREIIDRESCAGAEQMAGNLSYRSAAYHLLVEDLDMDSLDIMSCVIELEIEFKIEIDQDQLDEVSTVQDIVDMVTELVGERE